MGAVEAITNLTEDISAYAGDLCYHFANKGSTLDPIELQNRGHFLQAALLLQLTKISNMEENQALNETFCLALLAFVGKLVGRRDRNFQPMQPAGLARLQEALKRTSGSDWAGSPTSLLWTLTVAGLCASGAREQAWFATQLIEIHHRFGFTSLSELEQTLIDLLWVNHRLIDPLSRLWSELYGPDRITIFEEPERRLFEGFEFPSSVAEAAAAGASIGRYEKQTLVRLTRKNLLYQAENGKWLHTERPKRPKYGSTESGLTGQSQSSFEDVLPYLKLSHELVPHEFVPGTQTVTSDAIGASNDEYLAEIYTGAESIWSEAAVKAVRESRQLSSSLASTSSRGHSVVPTDERGRSSSTEIP